MKSKNKFKIAAFIYMFCICAILSGCKNKVKIDEPLATVFVVGARQNSENPMAYVSHPSIEKLLIDAGVPGSSGTFISISGNPKVSTAYTIKESDAVTQHKLHKYQQNAVNTLANTLSEVKADAPEADVLKAIQLAANELYDRPIEQKRIVVFDSCIGTTGILSYADNCEWLLDTSPQDIVSYLKENHELPQLDNVTVVFAGIGNVASPQKELNGKNKQSIIELWKAIVEAGGGKFEYLHTEKRADSADSEYPVTVVNFPDNNPKPTIIETLEPISFSEEEIMFIEDEAIFFDADKAFKAIEPVAEYLKEYTEFKILIVGTTATTGDSDYCDNLSKLRAQVVCDAFIELGIEKERISYGGLGFRETALERFDDLDENGFLIPDIAAQNRRVVIMLSDSELAKSLYPSMVK